MSEAPPLEWELRGLGGRGAWSQNESSLERRAVLQSRSRDDHDRLPPVHALFSALIHGWKVRSRVATPLHLSLTKMPGLTGWALAPGR